MYRKATIRIGLGAVFVMLVGCGESIPKQQDPPRPHTKDFAKPLDQGLSFINAIDESEVPKYLGRGIKDLGINTSRLCLAHGSATEWQVLESPVPDKFISKNEGINEVYYDVVRKGAKENAGVNLLKLQGFADIELGVGGSQEEGYYYRLEVKKTYTLTTSGAEYYGQSSAKIPPIDCGDDSCGNAYVETIKCGNLAIKSVKSNAFDAGGKLRIDAWDIGIQGELKSNYYGAHLYTKKGCFVAYPKPYSECGAGNYCENPYQDGVRDGVKCAEELLCLKECQEDAKYSSRIRKMAEAVRKEYLEGLKRGHQRTATSRDKDKEKLVKNLRSMCSQELKGLGQMQSQF